MFGLLEHIGAIACPEFRGVPACKKVDAKVLETLHNL